MPDDQQANDGLSKKGVLLYKDEELLIRELGCTIGSCEQVGPTWKFESQRL